MIEQNLPETNSNPEATTSYTDIPEMDYESEADLHNPEIPELEDETQSLPQMLPSLLETQPIVPPKRSVYPEIQLRWLVDDFEGLTDSVYEAVMIAASRARQIGRRQKLEIDTYNASLEIAEVNPDEESDEAGLDRFHHSKPTVQAMFELKRRRFKFRYPELETK